MNAKSIPHEQVATSRIWAILAPSVMMGIAWILYLSGDYENVPRLFQLSPLWAALAATLLGTYYLNRVFGVHDIETPSEIANTVAMKVAFVSAAEVVLVLIDIFFVETRLLFLVIFSVAFVAYLYTLQVALYGYSREYTKAQLQLQQYITKLGTSSGKMNMSPTGIGELYWGMPIIFVTESDSNPKALQKDWFVIAVKVNHGFKIVDACKKESHLIGTTQPISFARNKLAFHTPEVNNLGLWLYLRA